MYDAPIFNPMTEPDIVALGEPLIEMIKQPSEAGQNAIGQAVYRSGVGGDALNALVAAARQGARTGMISAVGDDMFGHEIVAFCQVEGIDARGVKTDANHPTGLVYIDPDPVERRFFYARQGSAASHMGPDDLPEALIAQANALHVTGVSLAISQTMRSAAFRAAEIARSNGTLVSFDLNFREKLWDATEALPVIEKFLALADIVLPSEDEAATLTGLSMASDMLRHFGRYGARLVILKRGAAGAVLFDGIEETEIPATSVKAVDSSGAGDSFGGAFLAHYLETGDPRVAARHAADAAAATVTGWGATASIPRRNATSP